MAYCRREARRVSFIDYECSGPEIAHPLDEKDAALGEGWIIVKIPAYDEGPFVSQNLRFGPRTVDSSLPTNLHTAP